MFVRITDAVKNKPFVFTSSLDNNLSICLHKIDFWVGYYNIYEDQTCELANDNEPTQEFTISAGLYNFEELVNKFPSVDDLTITYDKLTGLATISVPDTYQLRLTTPIKNLLGIDNSVDWITDNYLSDRTVEFTPKRLLIYLNQLSTTDNYYNKNNQQLDASQLIHSIPLSARTIGTLTTFTFVNPLFHKLQNNAHEHKLEFSFIIDWGNNVENVLNNHDQPIDMLLEIR